MERIPVSKMNLVYVALAILFLGLVAVACRGEQGPQGAAGPQGVAGPPGIAGPPGPADPAAMVVASDLSCTQCHDDSTQLLSKRLQWEQSKHAVGGTYVRATSASCAGCHSSEGFTARIDAGIQPNKVEEGIANPTPQNCRTCHEIHTTFTEDDFALRAQDAVTLMVSGETFDKGKGNLCASCHQPRAAAPEVGSGEVEVASTHWGPHRTQASTLLGIGGYGEPGSPSPHYIATSDSCVTCHLGPDKNHTKTAQLKACQSCHADLKNFDRNGVQTEVQALFDELGELLEAKGLQHDGHPEPGTYSEAEAGAIWNYQTVEYDRSLGVHNPAYVKKLLQDSIDALK